MKKLLFVCSQNRLRSPTAEHLFANRAGFETASAGLNNGADEPLSIELIEWADIIFVMENVHRRKLSNKFQTHLKDKRVICLDIPDDYEYMQPELVMIAGSAVASTFKPWKMNYSCYGNVVPHIHWHLFPRYESDADREQTPWFHASEFDGHSTDAKAAQNLAAQIRANLILSQP